MNKDGHHHARQWQVKERERNSSKNSTVGTGPALINTLPRRNHSGLILLALDLDFFRTWLKQDYDCQGRKKKKSLHASSKYTLAGDLQII